MNRWVGLGVLAGLTFAGQARAAESFTYWSMWNAGEPQQKVLARAIEGFTAETGIEVKVQWQGRDNLKKLAPTLNSPSPAADLVDGAQRNVKAVLVSTGSALDMAAAYKAPIPGEGKTVGDVIQAAQLKAVTADGHVFMVPYEVISSLWWYDAAAMPGFQPPKDWAGFTALLAARKAAGHAPIALDGDIATYNLYYFAEIAVRLLGPGKLLEAVSDRSGAALKDPKLLLAAQLIEALVKAGDFAPGYDSSKWPALQQKWATGKADFILNGTWIPSETASYAAPGFQARGFAMPAPTPGAHNTQEVSFIGFAVQKKSAHVEAAEKFIAYFLAKSRLAGIAEEAKNLTPRADVAPPEALAAAQAAIAAASEVHTQFDGVIDNQADYANKVLMPLVNELIFGVKSAAQFQDALVANTVAYWKIN